MGIIGGLFNKDAQAATVDQTQGLLGANSFGAGQQAVGAINDLGGMSQMNKDAAQLGFRGAQAGFGQSNQADAGQAALANQLALRAAGKAGPSIAEQQLAQSMGQVQQQGAGSLAAARGVSPGTAARLISNNQTNAAQQAAGQGAILRSQEQQAAEGQLANVLAQRRQGALGQSQVGFGGFGTGAGAQNAATGTIGQLANQQGALAANVANANAGRQTDVSKANAHEDNATGGGIINGIGGAFGLAHGGEVPGAPDSLAHALMKAHAHMAEAHGHMTRMASGGPVQEHGSYDFPAMDVRPKPHPKPKSEGGADSTMFIPHDYAPSKPSDAQKEGQDSEGKEKKLHLAHGGQVKAFDPRTSGADEGDDAEDNDDPTPRGNYEPEDSAENEPEEQKPYQGPVKKMAGGGQVYAPKSLRENAPSRPVDPQTEGDENETAFERHLKERDRARESNKEQDTQNTMRQLGEAAQHKAGGGLIGAAIRGIGSLFHDKDADTIKAANTEGGKTYSMQDTGDANGHATTGDHQMMPQATTYGQGSTFGANPNDESDTTGAQFESRLPVPSQLAPNQAPASLQQMQTPGFGLPTYADGGDVDSLYAAGGGVPGHARVAGNSLKNDTVPTMLSPGEVVLPRTISHDPDAAADFVRHVNANRSKRMAKGGEVPGGFAKVLAKQRELHSRLSVLESKLGRK
jgi:hypothetical protein